MGNLWRETMLDITSFIVWGSLSVLIIYGWSTTKLMKSKRNKEGKSTDLADPGESVSECDTLEARVNFMKLEKGIRASLIGYEQKYVEDFTHTFKLYELENQIDKLLDCIHNDFFVKVAHSNIDEFFHSNHYENFDSTNFTLIELTVLYKIFQSKCDDTSVSVENESIKLMAQIVSSCISSRLVVTTIVNKQYSDKVDEISNFFSEDFGI